MSKLDEFYKNLLKKIKSLEEEKDYIHAIEILEDELDAPYIPLEYEEIFEKKLLELKFNQNYLNDEDKKKKLSKEDIKNIMKDKFSEEDIIYFFNKFGNSLLKEDIDLLLQILSSYSISNTKKILILENLKFNNILIDIIFFNSNLKKEYKLNIADINFIESIDFFINANDILKRSIFQEPSLLEISYTIIFSFYQYFFPDFNFKYSSNEFVLGILDSINNMLKGTKIKDNIVNKDISKVIKSIK